MPLVIPFAAALVAILAFLAFYEATEYVCNVIRKIPFIGKYVANAAQTVLNLIYALLQQAFAAAAHVFTFILNIPVSTFLWFIGAAKDALAQVVNTCTWIAEHLVRHVYNVLVRLANDLVNSAFVYAARLVSELHAVVHAGILAARQLARDVAHAVAVEAAHALHLVKAEIYASIHVVKHDLTGLIDHAEHLAVVAVAGVAHDLVDVKQQIYGSIHAEVADLTKLVTSTAVSTLHVAEHYTDQAIDGLGGVITVDIPGVVAPVWTGLLDDVHVLEGVLGSDFPDIRGLLDSIPGVKGLDTALSIAGAATIARVMTRYLSECGVANCRNLHGVGEALHALFGLVGDAALLAVLVDCISDPQGAAHEIQSVVGAVVDPVVTGARDLLGV